MPRPRLLDLFCGAGGCSVGYHRAGFDVVGVDLVRQYDYPFEFHLASAMDYPLDGFDVVHASPPCKAHTVARHGGSSDRMPRLFDPHPDLLTPTLARFASLAVPWIIENVPGAPMPEGSLVLCGSMFGLKVRRHRLFATSFAIPQPACRHAEQGPVVGVYGHGGGDASRPERAGRGVTVHRQEAADALGIDWTARQAGLSQAIPPTYTQHIGEHLLALMGWAP